MAVGVHPLKTEVSKQQRVIMLFSSSSFLVYSSRQALTEVSVLSDVLQIAHGHQDYVTLDQVVAQPSPPVPSTYQYIVKKKVCRLLYCYLLLHS